ncbi:GNAT family N-acetyltransferase [Methylobacterium sp. E-045]|uniref:GNAT family N-acetyltransferase n=1 Tax=Methylobacterium sp. E-045 TaxID=2836575 RepID=UPI001FBB963D|nr:GNAT family N-acetyltransferase [Methylobacterium sp. E-045]MCJ2128054.1 GNAT family N-acetyltransferase [Methylobacterium sp. E-045]
MNDVDFREMLDAHCLMQAGCYVSDIEPAPDDGRYLWSSAIPEPGFNVGVETTDLAWVRATSARRGRLPAILVTEGGDALGAHPDLQAAIPTRWMLGDCREAQGPVMPEGLTLATEETAAPGEGYLSVCGGLYDDAGMNEIAETVFLPVLRSARPVEGVETRHLTVSADGVPVACASVYRAGPLAGLYNVGSLATRRGSGLGTLVTRAAMASARQAGADTMMLQCVAGGHVERLYAGLGFTKTASPTLMVFAPDAI